jgi:hypothetical protein
MDKNENLKNGVRFPIQDPTKGGRPPKLVSQTVKDLKSKGIEKVSKLDIEDLYLSLMNCNQDELKTMLEDEAQPMLTRIVIRNILADKGFEIIERMIDRAIGKAHQTQTNIIDTQQVEPVVIQFLDKK